MDLNDFDYYLPEELIAQTAVHPKSNSRLLVVHREPKLNLEDKHFYNIIDYLNEGDVLVVNETKVSNAKIFGKKETGSPCEVVLEHPITTQEFFCRIKTKNPVVGTKLLFDGFTGIVTYQDVDIFKVKFDREITDEFRKKNAVVPTPPYIKTDVKDIEKDYQTVYAKTPGSLAAPTAGLHFTEELMAAIKAKGVKVAKVCLTVSYGTFKQIRSKQFQDHKMDPEFVTITKENADLINNRKGRLIVVGTTTFKSLETAADDEGKIQAYNDNSTLFIYPGYKFKTNPDTLITNFHLPKSTLMLLVSAYYGRENIMPAYEHAVKEKYRFYSLGDSMILIKND